MTIKNLAIISGLAISASVYGNNESSPNENSKILRVQQDCVYCDAHIPHYVKDTREHGKNPLYNWSLETPADCYSLDPNVLRLMTSVSGKLDIDCNNKSTSPGWQDFYGSEVDKNGDIWPATTQNRKYAKNRPKNNRRPNPLNNPQAWQSLFNSMGTYLANHGLQSLGFGIGGSLVAAGIATWRKRNKREMSNYLENSRKNQDF